MIEISDTSPDVAVQADGIHRCWATRAAGYRGTGAGACRVGNATGTGNTDTRGSTRVDPTRFVLKTTPSSLMGCLSTVRDCEARCTTPEPLAQCSSPSVQARNSKRRRKRRWREEQARRILFPRGVRIGGRRASGDKYRRAPLRVGRRSRRWRCFRTTVRAIPDWAIDDQSSLLELIGRQRRQAVPVEVLESGMLRPKKSLLAVFGMTRHVDRVRRLTDRVPARMLLRPLPVSAGALSPRP